MAKILKETWQWKSTDGPLPSVLFSDISRHDKMQDSLK